VCLRVSEGRHALEAVTAVVAVVVVAEAPSIAGYALGGASFTGSPTPAKYVPDFAQHELWAREMSQHGRFLANLLTPEHTKPGWFVSPLELVLGLAQRATGIPYGVVNILVAVLGGIALALVLRVLAQRAGLERPGLPLLVALVAGSFQPLVLLAERLDMPGTSHLAGVGGDSSALTAGAWPYLPLAALVLLLLAGSRGAEPTGAFRRAGLALLVEAAIYPFFAPTLWLAGALYAALCARTLGWRRVIRGFAWFTALPAAPVAYYAVVLPRIDPEFAHFSRLNHSPIFGPGGLVTSLGLGLGAILGLGSLLRGNDAQRVLACFALAFLVALYLPKHPDRSHILYLDPLLVLGAFAAWKPFLDARRTGRWHVVAAAAVAAALASGPYYFRSEIASLTPRVTPVFLTSGDRAAFSWLAQRDDGGAVLARSDLSPWVAARSDHRVLVGHYLWTHDWADRSREVDEVFDSDTSPVPLIERFGVTWVLIDRERGTPTWARGVPAAARFDDAMVLRATAVVARANR
jgi:hypothetical protein